MNKESLHLLENSYKIADEKEREDALLEKQTEITTLLDEMLAENKNVGFTFTELLMEYGVMGYTFADVVIDVLDAGEAQREADWNFEDTIAVGAMGMGGPVGLA